MGSFGSLSLGNKFGIILGCLIAVAIGAGLVKLWINKRRLKNHIKIADQESTGKPSSKEKAGKPLDAGDLFGVRALEHGYFGGVAQSRPSSPSPSYVLAPGTLITNWGEGNCSTSSSLTDFPIQGQSTSPTLITTMAQKRKPSPLHLQQSDVADNMSVKSLSPGSYITMPFPSPTPNSASEVISPEIKPAGWISPLDVHFSRPTTPNGSIRSVRPKSYLPKLPFTEDSGKTSLLAPTSAESMKQNQYLSGPTHGPETFLPISEVDSQPQSTLASRSQSPLSPAIPSRVARRPERTIYPLHDDVDIPGSKRSNKIFSDIPIPPIPSPYDSETVKPWGPDSPVLRDSTSFVPIHELAKSRPSSHRSRGVSSTYSTATSILDYEQVRVPPVVPHQQPAHCRSTEIQSRGREQRPSDPEKRQSSAKSLSRTRDSLKRHSRKFSRDQSLEKRRSRERDQIYYDPTSHHRNRSGSVQGRSVDFSKPRESPFSNSAALSTNSASSSISTASAVSKHLPQMPESGIDSLSVNKWFNEQIDGRMSRNSLGDFYDAYYRQSLLQSQDFIPVLENEGDVHKRIGPLRVNIGGGRLANEPPIAEMATPASSPMISEGFPRMI